MKESIINSNGKKVIEICKKCDLRILNGRTLGDSLGRPTFHGINGTSTVDYIICNQNLVPNIKHFIVRAPCYLSDHNQIITWLDLHKTSSLDNDSDTHFQPPLEKLPFQYTWNSNVKDIFIKELKSKETQRKLTDFINTDFSNDKKGTNQCLNEFQNIISHVSEKSLKIKKKKRRQRLRNNVANKKWFDKECQIKRHQLRKLANQKHRNPSNNDIRDSYHSALKDYKHTLEIKKSKFHHDKIQELENATNDCLLFWKLLKNRADDIEDAKSTITPSPGQWLKHFQTLHSETLKKLGELENGKYTLNELDQTIILQEPSY